MTETFTVEQRGVGKPDYSREVSSSVARPGLRLKYQEGLKFFYRACTIAASPASWFKPPLGAGATEHLIDMETGQETPYTVPQGYVATFVQKIGSFTQDARGWIYVDGALLCLAPIFGSGYPLCETDMIGFSTAFVDPTGATTHEIDLRVTNLGGAPAEGGLVFTALLEAVGTEPLPTVKTVKCKYCGHEETVPRETTRWICPKCNQLNIYYNLAGFRGVG